MAADTGTGPEVVELDAPPALTPMLARVAVGALPIPTGGRAGRGDGGGDALPSTVISLSGATVDPEHLAAYTDVCGFRLDSTLPPTYLHMLGFPLSVQLMTRPDFPFGLLGMVHIRNAITQHRPVALDERIDLTAAVANLRAHPKGRQLDNVVTASVDGEPVWTSTSTYLKRGASGGDRTGADEAPLDPTTAHSAEDVDVASLPLTAVWRIPSDIGRRYGAVSGDRNPIHLSRLTARAFGFKAAIAHGMWTKARALAALEGAIPGSCTIDVAFKLPLTLPRTVEYATRRDGDGRWALGVRSRDGRPHLAGVLQAA